MTLRLVFLDILNYVSGKCSLRKFLKEMQVSLYLCSTKVNLSYVLCCYLYLRVLDTRKSAQIVFLV